MGMSATLPNVDGLARWLNRAQLYETDYRPVELSVFVKKGREIHAVKAFADTTTAVATTTTTIATADDVGGGGGGGECEGGGGGGGDVKIDGVRGSSALVAVAAAASSSLLTFDRVLKEGVDADHVVELARETMEKRDGGGVIIFCATKRQCETTAAMLARRLPAGIATGGGADESATGGAATDVGWQVAGQKKPPPPPKPPSQQQRPTLAELVEQLRRVKSSSSSSTANANANANDAPADEKSLASCVSKGVAWHNAGLHPEEKAGVEHAFRSGLVRVMAGGLSARSPTRSILGLTLSGILVHVVQTVSHWF